MKEQTDIQTKLDKFHKNKAVTAMSVFSDIAGNQFQGEFNVSGFHREILDLPRKPQTLWGIDKCLRIQETPDEKHSFIFHMGIFAKSIDLENNFVDPFQDPRFHRLQEEIISQFLKVLSLFDMDLKEIEVTYLDGVTIGKTNEGRDRLLKRKHKFPTDKVSKKLLSKKTQLFPVKSISNIDISPTEGALVGPRLEVAYRGVEIGTIVFNCFKIKDGNLVPINYVGGYAIGIERLAISLADKNLITSIPRYKKAFKICTNHYKLTTSSLFEKEILLLIFGSEVLASIPKNPSSRHQKEKLNNLKKQLKFSLAEIGANQKLLETLIKSFN